MKHFQQILEVSRNFKRNESGSMLVLGALSMVVVLLAAGVAIDYSRMAHLKSRMNSALDAAVLAAGTNMARGMTVNEEFRQDFEDFFMANIEGRGGSASSYEITDFEVVPATGEISASARSTLEPTFLKLAGWETLNVATSVAAVFSSSKVEVAMMLDVTGSMRSDGKIQAMQDAARDVVNILLPDSNTKNTRIALVPYSWSVNAGQFAPQVTNNGAVQTADLGESISTLNTHIPTTRCVTERGGTHAATDASYKTARLGSDIRAVRDDLCPRSRIQPLTNQRNRLLNEIGQFRAEGYTAGHLGIAWSYYLLSENWADLLPSESDPAKYSSDVKKVAILMTDGKFNSFFHGTTGRAFGPHEPLSSGLARDLCADMKSFKDGNPGITIYSVAFKAPQSARETLRDCANEDTRNETFYYSAESNSELRAAFREIATNIQKLRISK